MNTKKAAGHDGIKELTVFETADGERHETRLDAELHQGNLDFAQCVSADLNLASKAEEIANFIRTNSGIVAAYIQRCERLSAKPKAA